MNGNNEIKTDFVRLEKRLPDIAQRVVVLDATADLDKTENLMERRFKLVEANVDLADCKLIWLRKGRGKCISRKLTPQQLLKDLNNGLKHILQN